jgi:hypothetical protein
MTSCPLAPVTSAHKLTLQTRFSPDRIHTALRLFMQRYYGVLFRDSGAPD